MNKVTNQKAWLFVIPVVLLVSFNALIPLMTVVNYSVQETFGNNVFFWEGIKWFEQVLNSSRFQSTGLEELQRTYTSRPAKLWHVLSDVFFAQRTTFLRALGDHPMSLVPHLHYTVLFSCPAPPSPVGRLAVISLPPSVLCP